MKFIFTIYKFDINSMIYIGSTWNFNYRITQHMETCYDDNHIAYNCEIYKYIRNNNIYWNDISIEVIYTQELDEKDDLLKRQTEQKYIDQYDSKNKGLNTINAYTSHDIYLKRQKRYKIENSHIFNRKEICSCGMIMISRNIKRHQFSNLHNKRIVYLNWENIIKKII